jgi:DNA-binding beta-propeller fold protein YncE
MKFNVILMIGLLTAATTIFSSSVIHAAQLIYFTESPRGLYNFDTDTGLSTLRCSMTGTERFFAMDRRPSDGTVFAIDLLGSGLWTINTDSGATNRIGTLSPIVDRPKGITFNPITEELFVSSVAGALYKVSPATASTTFVGQSGIDINGHSFTPDGATMLAMRQGQGQNGLYSVDPMTAAVAYIGPGITVTSVPEDTAFAADGLFYGTDYQGDIFRVNTHTGVATSVGSTGHGNGLLGLIAVPEPSTLALLGMGGIGLMLGVGGGAFRLVFAFSKSLLPASGTGRFFAGHRFFGTKPLARSGSTPLPLIDLRKVCNE